MIDLHLEVQCPRCTRHIRSSLQKMRAKNYFPCPSCGIRMNITPSNLTGISVG